MGVNTKEQFKKLLLQIIDENLKQIFRETATHLTQEQRDYLIQTMQEIIDHIG